MANVPFFFDGQRKVFVGSAANRTASMAEENPGAHYQEIGGNLYESNGSVWNQISIGGAALVRPFGTGRDSKNRNIPAAAAAYAGATNSCTWTATDNVTEFWVFCEAPATTTVSPDVNAGIIVDVEPAVAAAANLVLMGYSCRESDAVAGTATFRILHGATVAAGTELVAVELAADKSEVKWFGPRGIACPNGLTIDHILGTVDVTLYYATAIEVQPQDRVLMVLDATSDGVANGWLSDLGGASSDVEYFSLPYGVRCGPFQGVSYFSRLDFDPSINSTRIIVEAQ